MLVNIKISLQKPCELGPLVPEYVTEWHKWSYNMSRTIMVLSYTFCSTTELFKMQISHQMEMNALIVLEA